MCGGGSISARPKFDRKCLLLFPVVVHTLQSAAALKMGFASGCSKKKKKKKLGNHRKVLSVCQTVNLPLNSYLWLPLDLSACDMLTSEMYSLIVLYCFVFFVVL